MDARI
jgi:Effector Associated Constant Component 1